MKSRALALLGISGIALAACSGGQPNPAGDAPEATSGTAAPTADALLTVTNSQSHGWARSRPPSGTVTVKPVAKQAEFERVDRAAATDAVGTGTPDSDKLQIQEDGVRYASGKTMFGPGGSGTIEELPLRTLAIRVGDARGNVVEQGNDGTEVTYDSMTRLASGLGATDGKLIHSAQVTEDGLVLKIGGTAIYYDFQRRFDMGESASDWYGRGPDGVRGTADDGARSGKWNGCYDDVPDATLDCTNWIHHDVKITFGRPSPAPHGHYAWYWNTRIPLPEGTSADDENIKNAWDRDYIEDRDLGSYELWMTNLARIDKNLEDAEGPPYTRDDDVLFLSHAAYGLLLYNDNVAAFKTVGRLTGYHFGYDAFADSDDARTTDIETAVSATFEGTTMAQMVFHLTGSTTSRPERVDLRGGIELSARIGGSGGGGISGVISGFEMLGPDGTWRPHAAIIDPKKRERLVLAGANYKTRGANNADGVFVFSTEDYAADAAAIGADGSYEGGLYLQEYDAVANAWKDKDGLFDTYVTTDQSKFRGTFYGPAGDGLPDLETAGHWFLSADRSCNRNTCDVLRSGPVYGSFGAAQ